MYLKPALILIYCTDKGGGLVLYLIIKNIVQMCRNDPKEVQFEVTSPFLKLNVTHKACSRSYSIKPQYSNKFGLRGRK